VPILMHFYEEQPELFNGLSTSMVKVPGDGLTEEILRTLVASSSFSAYLAHSIRNCVIDMIQVKPVTWIAVLILFLLKVPLHRFAHVTHTDLNFVVYGLALVCVLLFIYLLYVMNKRSIASGRAVQCEDTTTQSTIRGHKSTVHNKISTETVTLRVLQVALFLISYTLAREVANASAWKQNPTKTVVVVLTNVAGLMLFALVLPRLVPMFAALMALPPFVDPANVKIMLKTMLFTMEVSMQNDLMMTGRRAETSDFTPSNPPARFGRPESREPSEMSCKTQESC